MFSKILIFLEVVYFMNIDNITIEYGLVATHMYGTTKNHVATEKNSKQLHRIAKYKL